jgi:predicted ATPase/DNA-binding winged helix-turn-helix (wHTH) protein
LNPALIYEFENCQVDVGRVVLSRDGRETRVEPQVFDLLCFLIEGRGQVLRKEEILDRVWGDRFVSESALTTRIKSLRQAIGDDGTGQRVVRTVHGKGYEFIADVRVVDGLAGSTSSTSAGPVTSNRSVLPSKVHDLVGREPLLEQLQHALSGCRLLTLVGTGGVGKTSVAYELARRISAGFRDGVHVVELVTVSDANAAAEAVATALDVFSPQATPVEDAIVDMLTARHALLVLDNCEHLVDRVAALVSRILAAAPDVSILTTSREPLCVSGEHVWVVEPLSTGDVDGDVDVDHEEGPNGAAVPAVELFVERARAADPKFELTAATAPAVLEICRRLDGIPLAIELAASLARSVDVSEIARRLHERFRLLGGVRRPTDPRHRTLRDAISWSYDLLAPDERHLFESLSVFAGQFDLGVAESVCRGEDVLDLLTRLTQRSMLAVRRPLSGGTRYEMLETLREYGRGRLDDQRSLALFGAHAHQFAAIARSVELDLGTPQEHDAVGRADGCFADLRAAQRFALDVEDFDTAFGLICSIREFAMRAMRYEVFAWAEASSRLPGGDGHPLQPLALAVTAYGAWVRGELDAAVTLANQARAAETRNGVAPSGLVERVLANVLCDLGDVPAGLAQMDHQLALAEESGSDSRLAHACYMRAVASSSVGDDDLAFRLIARARDAGRRSGAATDLASASVAEGFATHDDVAALEAFARADRIARSAGNRWMSTFARTEASGLLMLTGRLDDACAGLAEVVDTWYRNGEWAQQWHTMSRCLVALHRIGRVELAAQVLGAIETHTTMGGPPVMVTLRDLAFETRERVSAELGAARAEEQRAVGAALPVATLVDRTRAALLGRDVGA